jgi:hypothetical protein
VWLHITKKSTHVTYVGATFLPPRVYLWRFSCYRWKHPFIKHMYMLHLVQYQWGLIKDSVPSLHTTHGFWSLVCTGKHTPVPVVGGVTMVAPRPFQFFKRVSHNWVLNCRCVIGFLGYAKEVLHAATYIMNMFTTVMSNKKKNMRCHHL